MLTRFDNTLCTQISGYTN